MEFWGIEVKPGKPLKVQPELGKLIHISQASLGEVKDVKGAKNVPLRLKVDDKSFIFGYLSAEGTTQLMVDLVFEKEFELSHDLKNGSVYFLGYTADEPPSDDEEFSEFDDESEDDLINLKENGNVKPNSADVKAAKSILAAAGKPKAKVEAKKEEKPESDDDDDEDASEPDSDEMALDGEADSSDGDDSLDDEDDSSDEEELPKVVQQSKKRPLETEKKIPASKKAKSVTTPEKSGKKGQTGTLTPSKAAGNKSKEQTPKSKSGIAPQSHTKAKHGRK
ncbi:hypothetical protein ACS0TY_020698 [Phlomoides rotata]